MAVLEGGSLGTVLACCVCVCVFVGGFWSNNFELVKFGVLHLDKKGVMMVSKFGPFSGKA